MKLLLSAAQMQRFDNNTMNQIKIPSCVLMERAALAVKDQIAKRFDTSTKVLVLAGKGNNGGDGLAIARLLLLLGYSVAVYRTWQPDEKVSEENARQAINYEQVGGTYVDSPSIDAYDLVVDAVFGIGLSRPVGEKLSQLFEQVNQSSAYVVAVDIPSGLNANDGSILGTMISANLTVTFGYGKKGLYFGKGSLQVGELVISDVGIYHDASIFEEPYLFTLDAEDQVLPKRNPYGNKGTFGKAFLIVGSKEMAGAAILATEAAFRSGIGMVKVLTHASQRELLLSRIPEAMVDVYDEETTLESLENSVKLGNDFADTVLLGPGIGTGEKAAMLVELVWKHCGKNLVIDADGLNIMSQNKDFFFPLWKAFPYPVVITPHMGEFARLLDVSVKTLQEQKEQYVRGFAKEMHCTVICKDARTFVASGEKNGMYCNVTGNDGMATAGSGDVLAGIVTTFVTQYQNAFEAAYKAVCLHGMCADVMADEVGKRSMMASDLIKAIQRLEG